MSRLALHDNARRALESFVAQYGLEKTANRLGSDNATVEAASKGRLLRPAVVTRLSGKLSELLAAEQKHVQPDLFDTTGIR